MTRDAGFNITAYCKTMERYLGNQDGEARLFWRAFAFSVDAHQEQMRKSGEKFISHPCLVAQILVEELGVTNPQALAAAVLHDTVEDVPEVTLDIIGELFGKDVEEMVNGCTKIDYSTDDRQTFYNLVHRKIFSGAASQVGVILIKLADRLHNMRTMHAMPQHKRQKIADETLAVYAPLSRVMGLYRMKRELYNLALQYKFPRQSQKLMHTIRQLEQSAQVMEIKARLQEEMEKAWIDGEILIRPRGLSAYYDPAMKRLTQEIDLPLQIIIVIDDIQSCYRALGVVNQNFPPIPRTIRDFIANPKPTGYQSLHAKANMKGQIFLFKIRTRDMLQHARSGVVREWLSQGKMPTAFEKEIREMFDILGSDSNLSYRDVIAASGKKEIYTYTPKGDRVCLPHHSIILDFAFKVHTEVGSRCKAAMVGQKQVGPDYVLHDGERVQILLADKPIRFDRHIQELCQSPKARAEISRLFRMRLDNLAYQIGEAVLHQEIRRYGIPTAIIGHPGMADILSYFDIHDRDEMYREIGRGRLHVRELIFEIKSGLYVDQLTLAMPTGPFNRFEPTSLDPICIKFSRCCNPVPVDLGLIGLPSERGLSVHHKDCERLREIRFNRDDVVELRWQLKQSIVENPQAIFIEQAPRSRVFMMLGTAPEEMKIIDIVCLSRHPAALVQDWEVHFRVQNLHGLKRILHHIQNTKLPYEFVFEQ